MTDYCCPFCGQNHGPDPRANRSPCPHVRALKFDSDGTILAFKLRGQRGWRHKSTMHRQSFPAVGYVYVPASLLAEVDP